ncbi:hypothetical protein EX30DRAFT_372986 [Ascodesmis nigricans]|uniref:Transcription and mRNA export factor SUS1 n=1 Tax=Ascodesmis nigricans TaxID=341454 RepID=A0A4S2MQQ8_9PEZI|nr:hypothetical protein EX30DRAFT_372986 [Ascodesmis nigricans]
MTSRADALPLKDELHRRLLESGELDKLESHLLHLLQSTGWTERLRCLCEQRLKSGEASGYDELLASVAGEAEGMVGEEVRSEVLAEIRRVLEGWVGEGR